jgi:hypothetical protein
LHAADTAASAHRQIKMPLASLERTLLATCHH